jgi:hypothetical protein
LKVSTWILEWRDEVEQSYIEDIEETKVKVEEVEEVEVVVEVNNGYSSGIEEIEGWWEEVNVGQWEEEIC